MKNVSDKAFSLAEQMANFLYNVTQYPGHVITKYEADTLKYTVKQWDEEKHEKCI